jgi:hypothetical protein
MMGQAILTQTISYHECEQNVYHIVFTHAQEMETENLILFFKSFF